jgi:general nucleoside transport system permease protein
MDDLTIFLGSVLSRIFISGTPLLIGTVGEIYSERSGIMNLGIEGMMATGAIIGFAITSITGNPWFGLVCAGITGSLLALIHAFISITLKGNQIVSGLALTMFGLGLSGLLGKSFIGKPLECTFSEIKIPILSDLPIFGSSFFFRDPVFYLSIFITIILWFLLYKSRWGVEVRSVGENPLAAKAMGVNVKKTQYICVLIGGFLAGIAGGYISLIYIPVWIEGMTGGRGWIIIALTILANWNPMKAFIGAYLFGGIYVIQYLLQPLGISPNFLLMLPYITTLIVLFIGSSKSLRKKIGAPEGLGITLK